MAVVLTVLGFLPIANWIEGGHSADWYGNAAAEWLSGSAIVVGAAIVLVIFTRRYPMLWRDRGFAPLAEWAHRHPMMFALGLAAVSFCVYTAIAVYVFSRKPISIDELVQVMQARTFAKGRLWTAAAAQPEFYSILNQVDIGGRYYGQFPPGGPAILALGVLFGAPWIVGPLCGAVSAAAFSLCLRAVEPRTSIATGAAILFALAPFTAFMSGSHMNHVPTLMWGVLGMTATVYTMQAERSRPLLSLGAGLAFGMMATIRPVEALAVAFPAGMWYLSRAYRRRDRWRDVVAAGIGVAVPVCAMAWVNAHTTGAPLLFGYEVLWGKSHNLGFHRAPWGSTHTPARGLELINLYVLRLQTYLYETPLPSLVPVIGALALTRHITSFDRYLFASAGLVAALYFAYWHDGFILGPRFFFALLPLLALWTARFPSHVRERASGVAYRGTVFALTVSAAIALAASIPIRAREHAHGFAMRFDYLGPARHAGVERALIFVRESWGTQLVARMWALGIPRSETETLYGNIDSCVLEESLARLERGTLRDTAAFIALAPLLRDSARVVPTTYSSDKTERVLPGTPYTARCLERLEDDRAGFTLLAPLLDDDWGSNIYARDMHERNVALLRRYPDRRLYLLRPRDAEVGTEPDLLPLSRDSVTRVWSGTR